MKARAAILTALMAIGWVVPSHAQPRVPSASAVLDRLTTETTVVAVNAVPGGSVVLRLQVRPQRGIKVFAPGAKNFVPVAVLLLKPKGVKAGKPSYDTPDYEKNPGNDKRVPLYARAFKIDHTVTIDKDIKPGSLIDITGALTYQTCDERIVYPKRTLPVRWTIRVDKP